MVRQLTVRGSNLLVFYVKKSDSRVVRNINLFDDIFVSPCTVPLIVNEACRANISFLANIYIYINRTFATIS